jgi:Cu/Zn superoxide dismutase
MRRSPSALTGLVVAGVLAAWPIPASAQEAGSWPRLGHYAGPLVDLQPDQDDVTDGAMGGTFAATSSMGTLVLLGLSDLAPGAAGRVHGVHLHTGPCVAGEPDTAGPHFAAGAPPSPMTEVWLDLAVQPDGWGTAWALAPFEIPAGGARSIVLHAQPTDEKGAAGDRLACIPLNLT